jgi:hypothetical protein
MNPKAPEAFQAKYSVEIHAEGDVLTLLSKDSGTDYIVRFRADRVQIVDNVFRTTVSLPNLDPTAGGAGTGHLVEVLALRLLIAVSAPGLMRRVTGNTERVELNGEQSRSILRFLFPDSRPSQVFPEDRRVRTWIRRTVEGSTQRLTWEDNGGGIFNVNISPTGSADPKIRLRSFGWAREEPGTVPRPRLRQILAHLGESGFPGARAAPIAVQGKEGTFPEGSPYLRESPYTVELCSFLHGTRRIALSLGPSGLPYQGSDMGFHPGYRIVDPKVAGIRAAKGSNHSPGVADAGSLVLEEQSWAISYSLSDSDGELDSRIWESLLQYLKDCRKTVDADRK